MDLSGVATSEADERERTRAVLRGWRLPGLAALARELGVDTIAIEAFANGGANLAPDLLAGITGIMARTRATARPAAPPARVLRNSMLVFQT